MKKLLSIALLLLSITLFAQEKMGKILILSEESGELIIDGEESGKIYGNTPIVKEITFGEHYIQVKLEDSEVINQFVTVDDAAQKIVKFKKENLEKSVNTAEVEVANLDFFIDGMFAKEDILDDEPNFSQIFHYAFDADDEIVLNARIKNKKGDAVLHVSTYPDGVLKYQNDGFRVIENEAIKVTKKGIYQFSFVSNTLLGKDCEFSIIRKPKDGAVPNFTSNVIVERDTQFMEVLNTEIRVFSINNSIPNRSVVKIPLPKGTVKWVYWIGVGQESAEQFKQFAETAAKGVSKFVKNPLYAYAIGMIPKLPIFDTPATINYVYLDSENAQKFKDYGNKVNYSYYKFKQGNNIKGDFGKIEIIPEDLNLGFWNMNPTQGRDVFVKIGALVVTEKLAIDE